METKPLVVIVGPTASGKTSLAIELAERFIGEIICADSRTVYKDMDIGTAKPTPEERERVPHWGLDLVRPNDRFTAADFKDYATGKINEIRARGKIPFLVGGTGLYVDAVLFDYQFGPPPDEKLRAKLESKGVDELIEYCTKNNILLPENNKNKRYVIRAIEQKSINTKRRTNPLKNSIIVGITTEATDLKDRIAKRAEQLFEAGVIEEANILGEKYGWNSESMTGNIYPLCHKYIDGEISIDELRDKFIIQDWRLAKRQITWLRRNPHINWLTFSEAKKFLLAKLATEH